MFSVAMSQIDQNINIKLSFRKRLVKLVDIFIKKKYVELTSKVNETYKDHNIEKNTIMFLTRTC